jgi:hypothetical protein
MPTNKAESRAASAEVLIIQTPYEVAAGLAPRVIVMGLECLGR